MKNNRLKPITSQLKGFNPYDPKISNWFRKKIESLAKDLMPNAAAFVRASAPQNMIKQPQPMHIGHMFAYGYKAETEGLPYYDRFPLTIIVDVKKEHFTGLNLHYLPPVLRLLVLDELMNIDGGKATETMKLGTTYKFLNLVKEDKAFAHAFKCYRRDRLMSKMIKVFPEEWVIVSQLPLANFTVSDKKVWSDL